MLINQHPNIEIRIFNPVSRSGIYALNFLGHFDKANRRMHNKSFTVDNVASVVGGRNIADEYFGAREDAKFGDLDVIGIGPITAEVSEMFDSFWNHETALPVPAFAKMPDDPEAELDRLRQHLEEQIVVAKTSKYGEAVRDKVIDFIERPDAEIEWVPYQLVYDSPDKGVRSKDGPSVSIVEPLAEALQTAQKEVLVV